MRFEDGAEQLENKEAEIKGNQKEEIIAFNKNEAPEIANERSEYQEQKSVTNGSAISSCEMKDEEKKKNEESSHAAGSGSSEELKRTERGELEELDDKEEDIAEECECHIFDHGKDIKRKQVKHHINDIAVIGDEYMKDLKKVRDQLPYLSTEKLLHNEELTRYRYEKQLLKKKMKKIKNEHEEQRSKWEEEKNEMAGKLSAATALSEFYQNLCRNWEEEKNVLAAKLCASTASSEFYQGLLHDSGY